MRKYQYVVRKYSHGCCYASAVFNTVKVARAWISGSPFATIHRTENVYYADNWQGWIAGEGSILVRTGRKCDEVSDY